MLGPSSISKCSEEALDLAKSNQWVISNIGIPQKDIFSYHIVSNVVSNVNRLRGLNNTVPASSTPLSPLRRKEYHIVAEQV